METSGSRSTLKSSRRMLSKKTSLSGFKKLEKQKISKKLLNWLSMKTLRSDWRPLNRCVRAVCNLTSLTSGTAFSSWLKTKMIRWGRKCYITCVTDPRRDMSSKWLDALRYSTGTRTLKSDVRLTKWWPHIWELENGMSSEKNVFNLILWTTTL